MIRIQRPALALIAGLGLFASLPAALQAQERAPALAQRDTVWAQTFAGLPADPDVRFGTLPNGMRYAIMRNATPSKQASLRLRVGSGSLEETDTQQGLAHFIEHMAFNGSTHVPQGEMIRILERHGLAFGADTNASTDWTETVYQLDLPQNDQETLDTGLMLMRETAGELTLAQAPMTTERGVVLSEERARDTPAYRVFKTRLAFLLKNQLAAQRLPIGSVDVVNNARAEQLRAYYDAYYRPERTTLIAVGDFDPVAMESQIRARFSDWKPATPAGPEPDLGKVARRGTEAQLIVEAGAPTSIDVSWLKPYDATPDSEAKRRHDTVDAVALAVLNRRLERLARGDNPPFIGAGAGSEDYFRSAKVVSLSINVDAAHWRDALTAAEETRRRAVQFGVGQDEVNREVAEMNVAYQSAADGAATRRTPALATDIAETVDSDEVFTAPSEDLALFQRATAGLGAAEVSDALRNLFAGEGPLVSMSSPTAIDGGQGALLAAFKQAQDSKLSPAAVQEAKTWPYDDFGVPGLVAENKQVYDLDTTFVRFTNGVRLTVKPTKFRDQQILVSIRVGAGRLQLPSDHPTAAWAAGFSFIQGGLKDLSLEDMEQVLSTKIYGAEMSVDDDAFILSGATRPQDFDTQLQVLTAYLTAPGWRPEGFQRVKTFELNQLSQMDATPQGVVRRQLGSLLHSGDARWDFPTREQIEADKPDDVRALLERPLADGPIDVVIVGDVSVDRAIQAVGATLGAIPARPAAAAAAAETPVRFPAPTPKPILLTHSGRADQALAYLAWPTGDFFADPQKQRALRLLQLVLDRRLVDQIRIAQGSTYSPSADWESSEVFPGYGYVSADVEIPPAKIDGFYSDVSKIVADLRDNDVGADELERARKPRIDAIEKAQQTNEYWLGQLLGADTDPRRLDAIRASIAGLERVTAADIRRVATAYLTDDRAFRLEVTAQPGASDRAVVATTVAEPPKLVALAAASPAVAAATAKPTEVADADVDTPAAAPAAPAAPAPPAEKPKRERPRGRVSRLP